MHTGDSLRDNTICIPYTIPYSMTTAYIVYGPIPQIGHVQNVQTLRCGLYTAMRATKMTPFKDAFSNERH